MFTAACYQYACIFNLQDLFHNSAFKEFVQKKANNSALLYLVKMNLFTIVKSFISFFIYLCSANIVKIWSRALQCVKGINVSHSKPMNKFSCINYCLLIYFSAKFWNLFTKFFSLLFHFLLLKYIFHTLR